MTSPDFDHSPFTNMVAIQFAFSVVLWFNGFRRVTRTSELSLLTFVKRNFISITILIVLAVMLSGSLQQVVFRELYESKTRAIIKQETSASVGSFLQEVRFETIPETTLVRALIRGTNPPSASQVAAIEAQLPSPPDKTKVELRVRFVQTLIINRDGPIYQDSQFGDIQQE